MPKLIPFHNVYQSTAPDPESVPHLVLLHGWGLHSIVWDDVMPGLLEHFRVTVVDLPGMGQSPLPNADYTLGFLAKEVSRVLPKGDFHLMGWSLGGLVAMELARREPERCRSLVTVACSPRYVSAPDWPAAMAPEILDKFAEVFAEDHEGTLIRFLALNCKGSATQQQDVRKLRDILYFCGLPARRALMGGLAILRDTDQRDELCELKMPVLMIFGEHDHIVPAAVQPFVAELAPALKLATIRDVAHVPFVSSPDAFLAATNDFWRESGVIR